MTMLGKLRGGGSEPSDLLTEREQRRLKDQTALELRQIEAADGRYPVELHNRALAAKLHHAAEVKTARKTRQAPVRATAATAALGYGGWGAGWLAELVAGPMGHMVATGGTAVVGAGAAVALSVLGRRRGQWRRTYDVGTLGAAGWATATAALGPAWWMAAAGMSGAIGVGASWRRAHNTTLPGVDLPAQEERAELPPVQATQDEGDLIAALWASEVITPGGVIPRAEKLMDRRALDRGYQWTGQLGRGDYFSKIAGLREPIAAALGKSSTAVLIEPYPGDASRFYLTVITRDALAGGVPYLGPLYHDGRVPIGLYADGDSIAELVVKDSGGVYPTAMTGDPRMGKSVAFEALAVALRQSGEWMVLFGDGDPGAGSSAIMAEVAHWPEAGPRGVLRQLECLEGVLAARQAIKATLTVDPHTGALVPITDPTRQRPAAKILPCPEYPGWMWMIDELHIFMHDEWLAQHNFGPRVETLLRVFPKYGGTIAVATHSRLNSDYRTSTFKGQVHARNSLAFRAESSSERASINGILVTPSELPHGGGYAYATQGGRLAMLRTGYPVIVPTEPFPKVIPDADSWLGAKPYWPQEENDPASAHRAAQQRRDEWRRKAEARIRGEQLPEDAPTTAQPGVVAVGLAGFEAVAQQIPNLVRAAKILPFPNRAEQNLAGLRLGVNAAAVLRVMLTERRTWVTGEIVTRTGLDGPAVNKGTAELEQKGLATRPKWGTWELTEQGQQVAA